MFGDGSSQEMREESEMSLRCSVLHSSRNKGRAGKMELGCVLSRRALLKLQGSFGEAVYSVKNWEPL